MKELKRLFGILDRWKMHYVSASALMIVALFVRSLEPKILQIAVDNVIAFFASGGVDGQFGDDAISQFFYRILPDIELGNVGSVLLALGGIYLLISVLRGGFLLSAHALTSSSTEKAIKKLRDRLFSHIQKLPMNYFTTVSKGELIQRSTGDIRTVRGFILGQVVDLIRMSAIFIFSFYMMYLIDVKFALIAVAFSPVLMISSFLFFKKESKVWRKHEKEADRLNTIVQENLNGIRTVQAFANEDYEIERFGKQNDRKLDIGMQQTVLHTLFWPGSDFVVNLQTTLTVVAGGYFALSQQITVGELLAFYSYAMMVAWPMRQIGRVLSQMGMALVAIERIYEVLLAEEEVLKGDTLENPLRGAIEFRNVRFGYASDESKTDEHVLRDISFKIEPGEKVAIIGPTGSGKSTIINLLVGLYDPDEGDILIDGKPISELSKKALRKRIGVAMQNSFLFSTTVRANMAYTNPKIEDLHVLQAAEIAQVTQIEPVLPDGYDTMVGEKGVSLSGGQRQRVSIARTLISNPDVMVLDDVTSAVDTQTEHAILEGLEDVMQDKTTIIISHRINTIQKAQRILVLENGAIIQEGTHKELEKQPGYYRQIHTIQSALEAEILGGKL
ncbi:MAG: ABC transporter ATP-binding protein/permease [Rhodothermaceae bacterium]|nr:ABC transporter ATP-binding protein/permease [Rhodothermaceae bacterium]